MKRSWGGGGQGQGGGGGGGNGGGRSWGKRRRWNQHQDHGQNQNQVQYYQGRNIQIYNHGQNIRIYNHDDGRNIQIYNYDDGQNIQIYNRDGQNLQIQNRNNGQYAVYGSDPQQQGFGGGFGHWNWSWQQRGFGQHQTQPDHQQQQREQPDFTADDGFGVSWQGPSTSQDFAPRRQRHQQQQQPPRQQQQQPRHQQQVRQRGRQQPGGRIDGAVFNPPFGDDDSEEEEDDDDITMVTEVNNGVPIDPSLELKDPSQEPGDRVQAFLGLCRQLERDPLQDRAVLSPPGDRRQTLSLEIVKFFAKKRQTAGTLQRKIDYWMSLDKCIRNRWPGSRTQAFGSTLSGFGSDSSDMDLCVFCDHEREDPSTMSKQRRQQSQLQFLRDIRKLLKGKSLVFADVQLIPATVAILKFNNPNRTLHVDMSSNSPGGALNTHLLFCYSQLDPRVSPLIFTLKSWAAAAGINDASTCTLSSYVLSLLAVNYLQCGVSPPVLPSLHKMYPRMFAEKPHQRDIFSLPYLQRLPEYKSGNKKSLGELFEGFFSFLTDRVDFSSDVPSVRAGALLSNRRCEAFAKAHAMPTGQWYAHVCVEEPFDRSNAAKAVCKRDAFDAILRELRSAREDVRDKSLSLSDLM